MGGICTLEQSQVDRGIILFSKGKTLLSAEFSALPVFFVKTSKNDSYFACFITKRSRMNINIKLVLLKIF